MKDLIIPHILRDRIIMYIFEHNGTLPDKTKEEYIQEIVEAYFETLNISKEVNEAYCYCFGAMTNYETFNWIMDRVRNKGEEDLSKRFDGIKWYSHSKNPLPSHKKDISKIMIWKYESNNEVQKYVDRLCFMLTGKDFITIRKELYYD